MICNALFLPSVGQTAPWISPNSSELRYHIQVLSDANVIRVPTTTYPLMWSGIARDLQRYASKAKLNSSQRLSLAYVRHELDRAKQNMSRAITANMSSTPPVLNRFGDLSREQISIGKNLGLMGDTWAAELNITSVLKNDALSADQATDLRFDGSYIAALFNNWAISVGSIERWWGPGKNNSLILSTNARPAPGIMLQRNNSYAFESAWLSWIGPWQLTAFANQLESERVIQRAKLLGMRFSFKPLNSLEIGLSRTAQWGGKNRRENLSTLKNLLVGNDNGENGENTGKDEPGNQLAGIDWRWDTSIVSTSLSFYGQYIGEDEAGAAPAKSLILVGLDTRFSAANTLHHISFEALETHCNALGDSIANCAYEHHLYKTGYRFFDRSIGASLDNDSRAFTLSAQHILNPAYTFTWSLSRHQLNQDASNRNGLPFSAKRQDFIGSSIGLIATMENTKIDIDITHFNKNVTILGQKQKPFTFKASLSYRY